jgi:hypothetical protein
MAKENLMGKETHLKTKTRVQAKMRDIWLHRHRKRLGDEPNNPEIAERGRTST